VVVLLLLLPLLDRSDASSTVSKRRTSPLAGSQATMFGVLREAVFWLAGRIRFNFCADSSRFHDKEEPLPLVRLPVRPVSTWDPFEEQLSSATEKLCGPLVPTRTCCLC